MEDKNEIFRRKGYRDILIYLYNHQIREINVTNISKKSETIQYSLISIYVKILEKYGLVSTEKKGRTKLLKLTEKGKEIASLLIKINSIMWDEK